MFALSNGFAGLPAAHAAGPYSYPGTEFGRTDYQSYVHNKGYLGTRYSASGHRTSYDFTLAADASVWTEGGVEYDFGDIDSPELRYVSIKCNGRYYLYENQSGGFSQVVPSGGTPPFTVSVPSSGGYPRIRVSPGASVSHPGDIDNVALFFAGTPSPGRITIKKVFESAGNKGESFSFTVTGPGAGGAARTVSVTAGDPNGVTLKVPYGTYYIHEEAKDGYKFLSYSVFPHDPGTQTVPPDALKLVVGAETGDKCTHDKCYTVTCTNRKLGSLTLAKKVDGAARDDTTPFGFTVTGPNGYTKSVSLAAGESKTIGNLDYGDYKIAEDPAPAGYRLLGFAGGTPVPGGNAVTFKVKSTSLSFSVTCNNQKLGKLKVLKTDSKTGDPVPGAEFHIVGPRYDKTLTTDVSGMILLENLTPGDTYTVTETGAPTGYLINSGDPVSKTIAAGQTAVFEFADDPVGWIRILKADAADPAHLLDGAVFQIADNADFTGSVTLPATSGGSVTSGALHTGHWWVKEITPPPGYVLPDNPVQEIDVATGSTVEVTFSDIRDEASLRITKYDNQTKLAVPGVTFELFDLNPSDPAFERGVNLVGAQTTGAAGQALFEHLTPGATYWAVETAVPAGYRLDSSPIEAVLGAAGSTKDISAYNDEIGKIKIIKTDGSGRALPGAVFLVSGDRDDFSGAVTLTTGADGTVTSGNLVAGTWWVKERTPPPGYVLTDTGTREVRVTMNGLTTVTFTNAPDVGNLLVRKTSAAGGAPLEGVTFELLDKDPADPAFTAADILFSRQTNANGEILFTDLPSGATFWVRETASVQGYGFDPALVKRATVAYGRTVEIGFENLPVAFVSVVKTDKADSGVKLQGAVYGVYCEAACTTLAQTLPATDTNGYALGAALPFGPGCPEKYYVRELSAPAGYLVSSDVFEVRFTTPGQTVHVAVSDVRDAGSVVIKKVDAGDTSKALAGAVFALYSDSGATQQAGASVTTGADGIARFDNLAPGGYWIKETAAPEGYDLPQDVIPVTVTGGVTDPGPVVVENNRHIQTGMMDYNMLVFGGGGIALGGLALLAARLIKRKLKVK
jgi:uncharacterized surface anchored protein